MDVQVSRRHVVWDWNGTLAADVDTTVAAVNAVLLEFGGGEITADRYRDHYSRPVSKFYERLLERAISAEEWTRIDDLFHGHYQSRIAEVRLAPGAAETLADVQRRGHGQSLLSMWRHDELVVEVARHGVGDWFLAVEGLAGVGGGGKAAHLEAHLRRLGVEPAAALMVGDALDDADAARANGVPVVLYAGGTHHRVELEGHGVPVIDSLGACSNTCSSNVCRRRSCGSTLAGFARGAA